MPSRPRALLLGAVLAASPAAAAPCPSLEDAAAALHAATTAATAPAAAPLSAAEAALACAPSIQPGPLATLFDAQASYFAALEAVDEAALATASAARLRGAAPGVPSDAPPAGALRLAAGAPAVELNGRAVAIDQPLAPGFYAVVLQGPAGRTAQLLALWPGEDLHITADGAVEARSTPAPRGVASPAPPLPPPAAPAAEPRAAAAPAPAPLPPAPALRGPAPARPWFIAAGGAAAAAAVTASIARAQIGAAANATAQADIDRARQVQLATGVSSYALMATTGGLLVVGLRR